MERLLRPAEIEAFASTLATHQKATLEDCSTVLDARSSSTICSPRRALCEYLVRRAGRAAGHRCCKGRTHGGIYAHGEAPWRLHRSTGGELSLLPYQCHRLCSRSAPLRASTAPRAIARLAAGITHAQLWHVLPRSLCVQSRLFFEHMSANGNASDRVDRGAPCLRCTDREHLPLCWSSQRTRQLRSILSSPDPPLRERRPSHVGHIIVTMQHAPKRVAPSSNFPSNRVASLAERRGSTGASWRRRVGWCVVADETVHLDAAISQILLQLYGIQMSCGSV